MKMVGMKNLLLAGLLACFFLNGQQACFGPQGGGLAPQGGGVDTGNPKGWPTNDPTKPVKMERPLEEMQFILPSDLMGGGTQTIDQTEGGSETIARGGEEIGPKIMKS